MINAGRIQETERKIQGRGNMYRILIAEDNKAISNLIKTHLSFAGYDTCLLYTSRCV